MRGGSSSRIAELEKEIARMKDFAKRARFTREALARFNAKLKALENELAKLKGGRAGGPSILLPPRGHGLLGFARC